MFTLKFSALRVAAFVMLSGCVSAVEHYAQIQHHEDTACTTGGEVEYFSIGWTGACHAYPFGGDKGVGSVSATGTALVLYASADCSGSALHTFSDTTTCSTTGLSDSTGFFNSLVISFNTTLPSLSAGAIRRSITLDGSIDCSGAADLVVETTGNACVATGSPGELAYVKYQTSEDGRRIIKTHYSDASCTLLTYADMPVLLGACTVGNTLNLPSCGGGLCSQTSPELGYTMSSTYSSDDSVPSTFAKLRFYRDQSCSVHQATDGDGNRVHGSDYSQYMGGDSSLNAWFDPQNTQSDQRGYADINVQYSLGTDAGSNRVCPAGTVHIYNPAECQVAAAALGLFETGNTQGSDADSRHHIQSSGTWNSVYPFGCYVHDGALYLNSAAVGGHVPSVGYPLCKTATNSLVANDGGSAITSGTVGQALYVASSGCTNLQLNGYSSIECDATTKRCALYQCSECACSEANHLEGHTCSPHIFARVESFTTGLSLGGGQLYQQFQFFDTGSTPGGLRCGGQPVIVEGLLEHCQISAQVSEDPTALGFIRVSTGWDTRTDYRESFYSSGDCSAQPAAVRNRGIGDCGQSAWSQDGGHYGSCTVTAGVPFSDMLHTVECISSQLETRSAIGCPQPTTYVVTEQMFDIGLGNGVDRRECDVVIVGPPGSIVAFDWQYFLTTGTLGLSPSETATSCHDEYVVLKDGTQEDSRQLGPRWCGNQLPGNVVFSGNTAVVQFSAGAMSSSFRMWVSFHYNHMAFALPPNPSFQLGSDVHIDWTFSNSAPGWQDCDDDPQNDRTHMCARSGARDHGWVGLYKNGTCEAEHGENQAAHWLPGEGVDGQGEDDNRIADHTMPYSAGQQLHKCYIAHRSVPIAHTEGTFTFFYGQDYTDGGWYSLRYFAGESGGTVCEAPTDELTTQCDFEPIATATIFISPDRSSFSGATLRKQLPGFEVTLNF